MNNPKSSIDYKKLMLDNDKWIIDAFLTGTINYLNRITARYQKDPYFNLAIHNDYIINHINTAKELIKSI